MFRCPICQSAFIKQEKQWICKNGHSFDRAKQGYVNLSLKQKKNTGDNKEMVHARTQFLENGYYDFMRQYVCSIIKAYDIHRLVDTGCGQGYYTKVFSKYVDTMIGIDLSKEGILYAAKHDKKTQYIVASIFSMPIMDQSIDGVVSLFVPDSSEEICRILKPGGYWITVGPGLKHCWELKEVLYEEPYLNEQAENVKKGFVLISQKTIHNKSNVEDVWALLEMTPYRYKSPKSGLEKVKRLKSLNVTFEFVITVWRKV